MYLFVFKITPQTDLDYWHKTFLYLQLTQIWQIRNFVWTTVAEQDPILAIIAELKPPTVCKLSTRVHLQLVYEVHAASLQLAESHCLLWGNSCWLWLAEAALSFLVTSLTPRHCFLITQVHVIIYVFKCPPTLHSGNMPPPQNVNLPLTPGNTYIYV